MDNASFVVQGGGVGITVQVSGDNLELSVAWGVFQ